jgi:periplasmic protein TonB
MHIHRLSFGTPGAVGAPRVRPSPVHQPAAGRTQPGAGVAADYRHAAGPRARRRLVIAAMVVAHGLAVLGLLQASGLREVELAAKPVFVALVERPVAATPVTSLPPPTDLRVPAPPLLPLPTVPLDRSPLPLAPAAPPPVTIADAPPTAAPAAAVPASPHVIPSSAVAFLVPPAPVYPRASARMRESGKALVRVWIDEAGLPREVRLATSTGFARLDDAALAAVRDARFKPCLDNGVAVAGWAVIPIEFELPK